jgi:hypothetical protein
MSGTYGAAVSIIARNEMGFLSEPIAEATVASVVGNLTFTNWVAKSSNDTVGAIAFSLRLRIGRPSLRAWQGECITPQNAGELIRRIRPSVICREMKFPARDARHADPRRQVARPVGTLIEIGGLECIINHSDVDSRARLELRPRDHKEALLPRA